MPLIQSAKPYIAVGQDERGSVVWRVISTDQIVECATGERANAVLLAMMLSRGL